MSLRSFPARLPDRPFWRAREAGTAVPTAVEISARLRTRRPRVERFAELLNGLRESIRLGDGPCRGRLFDRPQLRGHRFRRLGDLVALGVPDARNFLQDVDETRPAPPRRRREIRAAVERLQLGREPHAHRPTAGAGGRLHEGHVDAIDVRPLFAIDLDRHEVFVEHGRQLAALERLVLHHVTPVARRVADREKDRLLLCPRLRERLVAPRKPVHGLFACCSRYGLRSLASRLAHPTILSTVMYNPAPEDPMADTSSLTGKRVAMLVEDEFEDRELTGPLDALRAAGATVTIVGPSADAEYRGKRGQTVVKSELAAGAARMKDFDALVIPGGHAPEKMRMRHAMVDLARDAMEAGKPVAAICHGPQLLISANALKGRTLTCWPSIAIDVKNAGGLYVDKPVVEDANLITSRKPDDVPMFSDAIIRALSKVHA